MKMLFKAFLLTALAAQSAVADSKKVELFCNFENGAATRYVLDYEEKTLSFSVNGLELAPMQVNIGEKEITSRPQKTLVIDRFTLKISQVDPMRIEEKRWIWGRCEILNRKL